MEGVERGQRHPLAHEKGGFRAQDPEKLVPQSVKEVMAKIGTNIAKLKFYDLMKISGPARSMYPTTYLE